MVSVEIEVLHKVFPQLSVETLQSLYKSARVKEYPERRTLCKEGANESVFYIILDGEVEIYKDFNGQRQLLARKKSGDFFGEMALVLDAPRTADVITANQVRVVEIDRELFEEYLKSNAQIAMALAQFTLQKLLQNNQLAGARSPRKVFMSYAREEQDFVLRLATDLHQQQINVWLDQHEIAPGASWPREVGKALDICDLMLLILSPTALASDNVEDEWNYYLDERKRVVPVLYQKCSRPYRLRKLQYVDFVDNPYDIALAQLVDALHKSLRADGN